MIDRLLVDLLSAVRGLRATPAIPATVVLTTALAVGINLAMVGLIDRALLSPPVHVVDPDRVFTVAFETTGPSGDKGLAATTSGDEHVIGRRLQMGGLELEVIGVMPPGFSGHSAERTDLWLPLPAAMRDHPGWENVSTLMFAELGIRVAAGQTASSAASQLSAATGARVVLMPIIGAHVAPAPHRIAFWLAAVSFAVLLAGLANCATLTLVRSARRRRETCIRVSLGATRGRLVRQLLIESGIVASASACVALVLGFFVEVRPYAALQGPRLVHWFMGTKLLLLFGALALATAAVGLHAAFAHSVAQRRHEIAVRLAIGASRHDVRLMVLREGAVVAARGIVVGIIVATLAGWSARSLIFGLESPGVLVIALTSSLVLAVAMSATWIPALTASQAEPHELLRAE